MDEETNNSDKENCAPTGVDIQSPPPQPPIPINAKGNIFKKHVAVETYFEQHAKPPSNIARKRQRLGNLSNTPPRASYSSQVKKIFAVRPATAMKKRDVEIEVVSPSWIPEDAMKVFKHFSQALTCSGDGERALGVKESMGGDDDRSSDTDSSVSDGDSSEDGVDGYGLLRNVSGQSTAPLLERETSVEANKEDDSPFKDHDHDHQASINSRRSASPSPTCPSSDEDDPLDNLKPTSTRSWPATPSRISSHAHEYSQFSPPTHQSAIVQPLSIRTRPTPPPLLSINPSDRRPETSLEDPLNDLERAVAASFPPTPTREERRKTLNIDLRNTPPQPTEVSPDCGMDVVMGDDASSTDSWTGDEIYFPRASRSHAITRRQGVQSPTHHGPFGTPTHPPFLQSPRAPVPSTPTSKPTHGIPPASSVPLFSPLRAIRPNRFHIPAVRSPMGQGVRLSMERHPETESGGSDADDEESEGVAA